MYMSRAGLDWEIIIKIMGHKDTVNIVKFYDLKLEAQGLADVAVAIGQGHSVAKGAKPSTVVLENRSNVPVDKLLPVANTACDDAMLVSFHDTLDEFDTTSSELSLSSKVPRMNVACPIVVSNST